MAKDPSKAELIRGDILSGNHKLSDDDIARKRGTTPGYVQRVRYDLRHHRKIPIPKKPARSQRARPDYGQLTSQVTAEDDEPATRESAPRAASPDGQVLQRVRVNLTPQTQPVRSSSSTSWRCDAEGCDASGQGEPPARCPKCGVS